MKVTFAMFLLVTVPWLAGAEELVEAFRVTAPTVLDRPLVGALYRSFPLEEAGVKEPEAMELAMIRPADIDESPISIKVPHLCPDGQTIISGQRIALRERLPREKEVAALTKYDDVIKLLGTPTILPIGGEPGEEWSYDAVWWRLFTPVTKWSVRVLDVGVHRKTRNTNPKDIVIERMTVGGGMFTEKGRRFFVRDAQSSRMLYGAYEQAMVDLPRIAAPSVEVALIQIIEAAREQKRPQPGMTFHFDAASRRPIELQAGRKSVAAVLEELAAAGNFYLYALEDGHLKASRELDRRAEMPEGKDPFAAPK